MPGGLQDMLVFGAEAGGDVRALSLIHATRVLERGPGAAPGMSIRATDPVEIVLMVAAGFLGWKLAARGAAQDMRDGLVFTRPPHQLLEKRAIQEGAAMLTIGKLSVATGVKVPTIRYYEQIGLMPEAERSAGNQRVYSHRMSDRLSFIRHARDLGFPLEAIRELLSLSDRPDRSCAAADRIALRQLDAVNARIARLTALQKELQRMLEECDSDTIAECRVIEVLGNHALCLHDHAATGQTVPDAPL